MHMLPESIRNSHIAKDVSKSPRWTQKPVPQTCLHAFCCPNTPTYVHANMHKHTYHITSALRFGRQLEAQGK